MEKKKERKIMPYTAGGGGWEAERETWRGNKKGLGGNRKEARDVVLAAHAHTAFTKPVKSLIMQKKGVVHRSQNSKRGKGRRKKVA